MISRKLEYLIALAKEGHFARAASACNVSQPALSAGIHQLEQELGVQVVRRGQRYQGLTEEGEIVLAWAQRMESERTRLHQELRDRSIQIGGTLRLGVMGTSTPFTSVFTIPFLRRFPDVNLRVITGTPFMIQQGIEELTHDVAITFLEDKPLRYLRSQELYTQQYYIFAARGSRFAGRSSVEWEELKEVPLCLYPAETQVFGSEVYEMLGARAAGVPRMETNNMFVLVDHVRTGNWLSILPKPVLFMVAGNPEFEAIPLPLTADAPHVGIFVPNRGERRSPLADAFFDIATSADVMAQFREYYARDSAALLNLPTHMLPTHRPSVTR